MPMTMHSTDGRADATRRQILRAASHQFARRAYHDVGLDDILADAELTKGAMYFHFRSKYALALAIIDEHIAGGRAAANAVLERRLSGLETLIDIWYLLAARDLTDEVTRAGLNLIESVGRADAVQPKLLGQWIDAFAMILRRAVTEGDVRDDVNVDATARLIVALHMGLRQTSDLSDPHTFFTDLQQIWLVILAGVGQPERIGYMTEFIRRRTAVAVNTVPLRVDTP